MDRGRGRGRGHSCNRWGSGKGNWKRGGGEGGRRLYHDLLLSISFSRIFGAKEGFIIFLYVRYPTAFAGLICLR